MIGDVVDVRVCDKHLASSPGPPPSVCVCVCNYRIAGNIGGELYLAD